MFCLNKKLLFIILELKSKYLNSSHIKENHMQKTAEYAIAVIAGLLGLFYALMPHSVHINSGMGFGLPHTAHLLIGIVLIIVAIVVFVMARKS